MVQMIPATERKPSFGEKLGAGVDRGVSFLNQMMQQQQQAKALQQMGIDPGILSLPESGQSAYFKSKFPVEKSMTPLQQAQQRLAEQKASQAEATGSFFNRLMKERQPISQSGEVQRGEQVPQEQFGLEMLPQDELRQLASFAGQPGEAGIVGNMAKDVVERQEKEKKLEREEFESERTYHTGYSKELEKNVNQLRESLPKKEMALNFARNAIESGNLEYFSPDKLADATGIDLFRTSKGAQLITAGKENLLSNMSRVGAKAQNIWFEQRLNSMFPKIGQSNEANLTTQEMLEGEMALDKAYIDEFDRLSEEDEKNYGYVRKDISKRVHQAIKPLENHILDRSSYRMKEIEENEKGFSSMKKEVGKNVVKGTPLTLAMTKLYVDKFGKENALKVAEKNGYKIPTKEEWISYQKRPQEFRENL